MEEKQGTPLSRAVAGQERQPKPIPGVRRRHVEMIERIKARKASAQKTSRLGTACLGK